jgi:hypothetical protein
VMMTRLGEQRRQTIRNGSGKDIAPGRFLEREIRSARNDDDPRVHEQGPGHLRLAGIIESLLPSETVEM